MAIAAIAAPALAAFWTAFSPDSLYPHTIEDGAIEWISSIGFFTGAVVMMLFTRRLYRQEFLSEWTHWIFPVFWVAALLFMAGEEISWGQRLFDLGVDEGILDANRQQETNIHNLEIVYRVVGGDAFFMAVIEFGLCLALPILGLLKVIGDLAVKFRFPIPPLAMAPLFLGTNVYNRHFSQYFVNRGFERSATPEVAELLIAIGLAGIALFFFWFPHLAFGSYRTNSKFADIRWD